MLNTRAIAQNIRYERKFVFRINCNLGLSQISIYWSGVVYYVKWSKGGCAIVTINPQARVASEGFRKLVISSSFVMLYRVDLSEGKRGREPTASMIECYHLDTQARMWPCWFICRLFYVGIYNKLFDMRLINIYLWILKSEVYSRRGLVAFVSVLKRITVSLLFKTGLR